ncbi:uncharacterized protein ACRADG_001597 [Cochliomyia hominivorax]
MISNTLLKVSCLLAAVFIFSPSYIEASCNTCSPHGIACINETSYHLCFENKANTNQVITCPGNKVCSSTKLRCVEKGSGSPACEPNKGCGDCRIGELFACTSRTTFAQCHDGKLTTFTGVCPEGFVCETREGGEICKNECDRPNKLECDRESPL